MIYVESEYPAILIIAGLLLILGFRREHTSASSDKIISPSRWETIDGLRGFLALGVYLHHAAFFFTYLKIGIWNINSDFYSLCGEAGVVFFFLITAFLFYGKILDDGSRINWMKLYIGRFFRISPLYLTVIFAVFIVVSIKSRGLMYEGSIKIAQESLTWLGLGILGEPDINRQSAHLVTAGVTWTLRYEWIFYFSLPLLALGIRFLGAIILPVLLLAASAVLGHSHHSVLLAGYFGGGMLAAFVVRKYPQFKGESYLISILISLLIFCLFRFFSDMSGILQTILATSIFFLFCAGNNLFGLLKLPAASKLGKISYGIYLWHGVLLTVTLSIPYVRDFALSSETSFWLVTGACSLLLVGLSSATYWGIEKPGMAWGRALAKRSASSQIIPVAESIN